MAIWIPKNRASPTNDCIRMDTTPAELHTGPECERVFTGNDPLPPDTDGYTDGYADGYRQFKFVAENPNKPSASPAPFKSQDISGYHRFTVTEVFAGETTSGLCASPYSRAILGDGGFNDIVKSREEQLLQTTGKSVTFLRRQHTGVVCPCKSVNRGRSRARCEICYGTSWTPGYIPFINQKDVLGRIRIRFEPFQEKLEHKELGAFQEVTIQAWGLSEPTIRHRDIFIVYTTQGEEEFRYEVRDVTRNDLFGGVKGAQKFTLRRLDPNSVVYKFDPFRIPDLADISVDLSDIIADHGALQSDRQYEQLGTGDDRQFANVAIENLHGDAAFSAMFTEGYKNGYEVNFRRILEFRQPLWAPDFNEDGEVDGGHGPIFKSTSGQIIRFSTPQQFEDNAGINPLEVLEAEKKRHFLSGWTAASKHAVLDAENELRARGLL